MSKSKKYPGVYTVSGIKGTAYGIDYIHPQTGARVRKIIRDVTSEADAFQIRSIEIADASRGALKAAYGIKVRLKTMLFEDAVKEYLEWSKGNKRSWMTDEHNSKPLKRIFGRKRRSQSFRSQWMPYPHSSRRDQPQTVPWPSREGRASCRSSAPWNRRCR